MKKVVLEIIQKSESAGAFVDVLCSDMGPNNVSLMNKLGFGVKQEKNGNIIVKNKIQHPVDKNRSLFLVYDIPHVEKNIANGWRNYRQIEMSNELKKKYRFHPDAVIDIQFVSIKL